MCQGLHRTRKPSPPPTEPAPSTTAYLPEDPEPHNGRKDTTQGSTKGSPAMKTLQGVLPRAKAATAGDRSLRMMEMLGYGPKLEECLPLLHQ